MNGNEKTWGGFSKTRVKCVFVLLGLLFLTGCAKMSPDAEVGIENQVSTCINKRIWEGKTEADAYVSDVYENRECIVTIISDDGRYDSGVNYNRLLGERGLKGTVAGVVKIVKKDWADWNKILEEGNIDIVSHSYSHQKMAEDCKIANDIDALTHEIADADKWYEKKLAYEQIAFVCPENQMCENGYGILRSNDFWAVRRGTRGYNTLSPEEGTDPGQWFNLMVQGICDEGVDTDVRNSWIDTAEEEGIWLIEMWHDVMPEENGMYQTILIPEAEVHLDYIKQQEDEGRIWVATYTEAVKYIREKQNCKPHAFFDGNELHVLIELERDDMNYSTFDQPVTVIVALPDDLRLSEENNQYRVLSNNCVSVNAVPGVEVIIPVS